MTEECWVFFKIAKDLGYISDRIVMIAEKEETADDLKWEILEENEQQEDLTKQIRKKSIYDFLRNNGPSRWRACDYSIDEMKYVTSQMLDEANEILAKELEESTWEDEMKWEEDDLFHDYNPAKVMIAEEVKAVKTILE